MVDYTTSAPVVLDLCTRKRAHSPDHAASRNSNSGHTTPNSFYDSEIGQYSPVSNSDSELIEVTSNSDPKTFNLKSKSCRPFKAYIKDPLGLTQGFVSPDVLLQRDSSEAFNEFRSKIMSQVHTTANGTNKNMRRTSSNAQNKNNDPSYWEKRRKNNEAAKRSRDARRAKEDEIAIRCAFLEQENFHLKFMTESLKKELERLQEMIYLRKCQSA